MPPAVGAVLDRRRAKAEKSSDILDLFNYEQLAMYVTQVTDLPERAEYLFDKLRTMPMDDDPAVYPFSAAGVHLVEIDPCVLHRLKVASVWIRMEQDERLDSGDISHLHAGQEGQAFSSSAGLYSGVYMFDAYIAPLLSALAPRIWGFSVVRSFGCLIFSFGRGIAGTRGDAAEMLQLISLPGADAVSSLPAPLHDDAAASAIRWWVQHMNLLFGVLSDLAVFTDQQEFYRADKHLEAILTVEQIVRRTASLQVAHRDAHARRTLMFSVLDSVQRANGWDLALMFRLGHAEGVLADLEASIPDAARGILLPMARRAVEALRRMQDGFFIRRQLGTDNVELRLPHGRVKAIPLENATAQYLKLLRDATHGHGGKGRSAEQTAALLAHHDGDVPHDVGLLAYLYLLDMVANPERLRRCFYDSGR